MMKFFINNFLLLLFMILFQIATSQDELLQQVSEKRLANHAAVLAADSLKGRGMDGKCNGLNAAADYIRQHISENGLQNSENNYFQSFPLFSSVPGNENSFIKVFNDKGRLKTVVRDFAIPDQDSEMLEFSGELVFAGFGYTNNDFHDAGIKNKIVIFSAGTPETFKSGTSGEFDHPLERTKIKQATDAGARGIILVTLPYDADKQQYNDLKRVSGRKKYAHTPFNSKGNHQIVIIDSGTADAILGRKHLWKKMLTRVAGQNTPGQAELRNINVQVHSGRIISETQTQNVLAYIEGSDPELKKECVLFMAHYDHLGMSPNGEIYNGADDNASGAAVLLELAQLFAGMHEKPKRSIVFLWPSAEEVGLLGSEYYSNNPLFALDKTVACINLDMVGRVAEPRDSIWDKFPKKAKDFDGIFTLVNHYNPSLKQYTDEACAELGLVPDYNLPSRFFYTSDHFHFHRNRVPVLNLSTGYTADYHKTTDEAWRLRPDKMKRVAQLCLLTALRLANGE